MQTRSWDSEGVKYRTEIVADRVQFGPRTGGPGGAGASASGSGKATHPAAQRQQGRKPKPLLQSVPADTIDYPEEEINPEDIPF